ncbi:hypothetical protein BH11MYX1_BH11MYX1_40780 [soil metagenome]
MKRIIMGLALVGGLATAGGCTYHSSIAMGPSADKVFVVKTTSYIVWSVNKMELCSWSGTTASNCVDVTEQ